MVLQGKFPYYSCIECVYLTIPYHLADTKPHPNPSLDFS